MKLYRAYGSLPLVLSSKKSTYTKLFTWLEGILGGLQFALIVYSVAKPILSNKSCALFDLGKRD